MQRDEDSGWDQAMQQWQMLLQLAVAYTAGLMWFNDALFGAWEDILQYDYWFLGGLGSWLNEHGIAPAPAPPANERHLGVLAAAGWHMILVMLGFILGNTLKRLPLIQGVTMGHAFVATVGATLYIATRHGYENDLWGVRPVAESLRWPTEIPESSHYLAVCGAVSQVLWLSIAMALSSCDSSEVGYCPVIVAKYLNRIVVFYLMTFAFFRFATIPFWNFMVKYSLMAPTGAEDAAGSGEDVFNMAYLASGTHTLTIILGIVSARFMHALLRSVSPSAFNSNTSQVFVLLLLCGGFSLLFSMWVSYALSQPVDHVVRFAQSFLGREAVAAAAKQQWSSVHTVTMSSYATWFACGVVFEQCWGGSASNMPSKGDAARSPGGVSAAVLALVVSAVILPMAWLGGYAGFVVLVVLLWPQPSTPNPRQPRAPADAYKKVSWKKATADCPRTGEQYLVIGVGFVGVSLVKRLLERGETKVRAFDISPRNPFEDDPRVEYVRGNVCKMEDLERACKGVHTVYATFAMIRFFERMDFQAPLSINVNINGTQNVIDACKKSGVKLLIQTSTSNVMACPKLAKLNMSEEAPYVTRAVSHNHYSWTKAEAEKLVLAADCPALRTTAIRPCSGVFGANDRTLVERFLRHRVLVMPVPAAKIDYVFCENVVLGHLKAEARLREGGKKAAAVGGQAFNISNHEPATFEEFGIAVQRYHGPGLYRIPAPRLLLQVICHVVEWIQWISKNRVSLGQDLNITTPPCLQTAGMTFTVTNDKSKECLNYSPCWNFDEAIQQSLADFAEQQKPKKQ